jgi:multiple RNA-binding domain-containing protein 1
MSIDDVAPTTRVFVSGLPRGFSSKELRVLFEGKFAVTDTHVLPDRRIGFVGFATHELAQQASKYFDRSYIRMSRISASLAKPVEVRTREDGHRGPVSRHSVQGQKRKREGRDDGEVLRSQTSPQHDVVPKTSKTTAPNREIESEQPEEHNETVNNSSKIIEDSAAHQSADGEELKASDSDWLRSRTNRVLDLVEPAGDPQVENQTQDQVLDAEEMELEAAPETQDETSDDLPVPHGRLFIRNLPFEASEDDLRTLLTPYGHLEEVRIAILLLPIFVMFSDRDILCFANDSQLERDFSRYFSLLNSFGIQV